MASDTARQELHEAKNQAKTAARSTLLAMRSALDFVIHKLEDDDDKPPAPSQASSGEPEGSMATPGAPGPAMPGDQPSRDDA
jgi:hypothetical protein